MENSNRPFVRELLTTSQVARAIGVSEASMKRWCDKGMLPAVRTVGGHRRLPLNGVINFLRQTGHPLVRPEILGLPATTGTGQTVVAAAVTQFTQAVESGDEEQVCRLIFNLYLAGHSACDIADRVIGPSMQHVGERWSHGDVHIYQERRGVECVLRAIHQLRTALPSVPSSAPYAMGASSEGDPYALPTALIELVLREAGWRAESFGTNIPFANLRTAIEQRRPRLFWLSVSYIPTGFDFLSAYADLQQGASQCGTALVVGGRALSEDFRRQMSYSAFGDNLRHMVSFAATLQQQPAMSADEPRP